MYDHLSEGTENLHAPYIKVIMKQWNLLHLQKVFGLRGEQYLKHRIRKQVHIDGLAGKLHHLGKGIRRIGSLQRLVLLDGRTAAKKEGKSKQKVYT